MTQPADPISQWRRTVLPSESASPRKQSGRRESVDVRRPRRPEQDRLRRLEEQFARFERELQDLRAAQARAHGERVAAERPWADALGGILTASGVAPMTEEEADAILTPEVLKILQTPLPDE